MWKNVGRSLLVQTDSVYVFFQVQHYASVLGPWSRVEAQFCHLGVSCIHHSVRSEGRTLHQSECHLRQPGPATTLPGPHRVCRRIRVHRCWRLRLSLFLTHSSSSLNFKLIPVLTARAQKNLCQATTVSVTTNHLEWIFCLLFLRMNMVARCLQLAYMAHQSAAILELRHFRHNGEVWASEHGCLKSIE